MRAPSPTPRRQISTLAAATFAMALALFCSAASARPEAEKPRVGRFLADRPAPILSPANLAPALMTPALGAAVESATPSLAPSTPATRPNIAERVSAGASDMVLTAMNFLGVPYKRGGSSESSGFDCSGFTRHIFELSMGLVLPRKVDQQATAAGFVPVKRDELRPGDLVFFNTLKRTFSHVGIYVGEGRFIHSPRAGGEVRVEEMSLAYWKKRFTGARRAESAANQATAATAAAAAASAAPTSH